MTDLQQHYEDNAAYFKWISVSYKELAADKKRRDALLEKAIAEDEWGEYNHQNVLDDIKYEAPFEDFVKALGVSSLDDFYAMPEDAQLVFTKFGNP